MFGNRRRRAVSNPPVNSNVNASAATAAAQAFLSSQASNTSLSSAAAAAALRSRPTTPTSVADIQTKRTIRRNGSTSSAGSSVGGSVRGPPGSTLVRRGSSGSMTERTFRESSPVPSAYDAPPVPAIPQNITKAGKKTSRRSASMDAPGLRIASPPPNKAGGRGSSLGPSATASRGSGPRNPSLSSVSEMNGESRGSVNFSYPTSTRPMSPEQRRLTCSPSLSASPRIVSPHNQNLVYDPNTRRFLPLADILAIEQRLNGIANAPVKKKKRNPPAQGTHLAAGSVGGRLKGTALDAMERASNASSTQQPISQPSQQFVPPPQFTQQSVSKSIQQPVSQSAQQPISQPIPKPNNIPKLPPAQTETSRENPQSVPVSESNPQQNPLAVTSPPKKKKKRVIVADSDSDQASILPNSSADDSDVPSHGYKTRAGAILAKKPSVVREDREREETEDDSPLRSGNVGFLEDRIEPTRTTSPSLLPRSSAGRGHGRAQSSANYAQERQHTRSASQPPMTSVAAPSLNEESPRGGRVQSVSPARTPHFMATPETLTVRHQPPARSVSPRKSALKHSSMSSIEPRGPPSDGGSLRLSEVSNDEEQPRKKANRVSFDEGNNVVLGQSTTLPSNSPMVPSPQVKRGWFNIGRGKKKDIHVTDEDDDEVMKPRPALPSFGSVRERKTHRETEERVLVRPPEQVPTIAPVTSPTSPLFTSHTGNVLESPMGQSNDHVAGSLIAHDATSKNAANISKSREPLPPDVTSLEGTGEISDASSTYSLDNSAIGIARSDSVRVGPEDGHADTYRELASPTKDQFEDQELNEDIPEIAVQMPTPTPEGTQSREWLDMPGGYRGSGSSTSSHLDQTQDEVLHTATENGVIGTAISPTFEKANATSGPSNLSEFDNSTRTSSEAHPAPISEESEGSENDSIYSDAAEEFEAPDDGGFMSLDAVVESPVSATAILASEPDSPRTKLAKERAYMSSQLQRKSSEPDPEEGWEKAQQYWKNLSVDRKKQLELDAFKVADEEEKEEATPTPKPKKAKKKSVTIQSPTSPIMQTMQASPFPQVQKQPNTERSYMIQPGLKAGSITHGQTTMRSSMRAGPPHAESVVHIRQSMRGSGSTKGATQNGTAQPNEILQKKQRPVSLPPAETQASTQAVNRQLRLIQGAAATATSPNAQRNGATVAPTSLRRKSSGDSDTSFKRARPATDGISMRCSMRRESDVSSNGRQQSPLNSSRFSLRSSSPGGPPAVTMRGTMRSSLRGSNDSTARAKSPIRMPGFGRSSSARPAPKQKSTQRSSRFADSSDEDEPRAGFRSRFGDSSDDDEPTPIAPIVARPISSRGTPVRSIPKPIGYQDGDSSDLPDSDDESRPATAKSLNKTKLNGNRPSSRNTTAASGNLQRSGSGRGTIKVGNGQITPITPPRPQNAQRGSILSMFRKKQDPNSKVRKYNGESPARRDTHLERSKEDLEAIKRPETRGKADSPRVLKKNPRQNSGSWPLANDTGIKVPFEEGRPFSADTGGGIVGGENKEIVAELNGRPEVGNRRFTATGLSDVDVMGQGGNPRKKKKFQVLRKMFRLED